jgi:hypothetical protein
MPSRRERGRTITVAVATTGLVVALALGAVACGADGDDDSASGRSGGFGDGGQETGSGSEDATDTTLDPNCDGRGWSDAEPTAEVAVTMGEYSLAASPAEVPAGTVEITADNQGHIFHELVVVRWDGDPGALPQNDAGGADQVQFRDDEVGRIFDFVANTSCTARFDLEPGTYALICNLVDDGFNPHYSQGMFTRLTVR